MVTSPRALVASTVTLDYQFIVNPAYNRDRGPVSVIGARARGVLMNPKASTASFLMGSTLSGDCFKINYGWAMCHTPPTPSPVMSPGF
jgi:hypothetical protein